MGKVVVGKGELRKDIDKSELDKLNRPASLKDIQNASTREELSYFIDRLGGIQGSQEYFTSRQLEEAISKVLNGQTPIESITRTAGLRQRVAEIKRMEEVRAEMRKASKI